MVAQLARTARSTSGMHPQEACKVGDAFLVLELAGIRVDPGWWSGNYAKQHVSLAAGHLVELHGKAPEK